MATTIKMPQLGESVTEGTVTRWLKAEGEWVERDEPLLEVMTDKVNAEITSVVAGVLVRIVVPDGTKVAVGEELAVVDEHAKVGDRLAPEAVGAASRPASFGSPSARVGLDSRPQGTDMTTEENVGAEGGGRYSPLVRRLAREHGVDLALVRGSGLGGRVTKDDVLAFVTAQQQAAAVNPPLSATKPAPSVAAAQPSTLPSDIEHEIIQPSPMRLSIAEHMVHSKRTAPHAWTVVEVNMTPLARLREQAKDEFSRREGISLTYLPFVIKAVVATLKEMPIVNAAWVDDKIVLKKQINIGVAVALDDGLIVPVVRNADQMSLAGLAKAVADLSTRARGGKLKPADVQGGTFTVNNPGAFGSVVSAPIINQGQAGILAMEAIVKRPVVIDDAIAIRSIMNLDLSFDHRVLDGITAGRFLQAIKKRLEAYGPDTTLY